MSATFTVINPATARPIREIARATVEEVDAVVARAKHIQRAWAGIAPTGPTVASTAKALPPLMSTRLAFARATTTAPAS